MHSQKKRIIITGATGGIGKTLCQHLASNYQLVLATRNMGRLCSLADSINAKYCQIDFANPTTFSELHPFVLDGLDGIVVMPPQPESTSECLPSNSAWELMFKQSFIGPVALIREMIPFLKMKPRAKVVIVSGISSAQVLGHYATSNVLRTAWLAQAKTMAHAFGPERIHFNTLSLGGVLTDEYVAELKVEATERAVSYETVVGEQVGNVPLRKYATPLEVAYAIEGLLSHFSDHISGANIMCDGGFTRAY